MFSYRHSFHAGNHGDVLKHITLLATLRHLMRKPTPLTLIDTHAGAGMYRLDERMARTSGEAGAGILRLQNTPDSAWSSEALRDYLGVIGSFNPGQTGQAPAWKVYPGSPLLMHRVMSAPDRTGVADRLRLFEIHPTDADVLQVNVRALDAGRRVTVVTKDGFDGLKALLPPPPSPGGSRRALVHIDPSYEIKSDYAKVQNAVADGLKRFTTGVYLVWYPVIARPEAHTLPRRLQTLASEAGRPWLRATLNVGGEKGARGMRASGVFVINPPYTLAATLRAALAQVLPLLRQGPGADWAVENPEPR